MKKINPETSLLINLWSINTVISKRIDATLGFIHGIGFTEYMVLFHLNSSHNKTMRRIDLANKIGLTASGITRLVAPMEKIGLVGKERNERDARVSLVKISSAGESILNDASISLKETAKQILADVKKDSYTTVLAFFKAIDRNIVI